MTTIGLLVGLAIEALDSLTLDLALDPIMGGTLSLGSPTPGPAE
jgi:hypothetical protein